MFHAVFVHEFWFLVSSNKKNMLRGTTGTTGCQLIPIPTTPLVQRWVVVLLLVVALGSEGFERNPHWKRPPGEAGRLG